VIEKLKELINIITYVTSERKGIRPKYSSYHVIKVLELLGLKQPIGRIKLAEEVGLGETSIRTMIRRLKDKNIVIVDPVAGAILSDKGLMLWNTWSQAIKNCKNVNVSHLIGNKPTACLIISKGENVVNKIGLIKVRDTIIRHGADGALIVLFDEKGAYIPSPTGEKYYDEQLTQNLNTCSSEDVVLITWSKTYRDAERSLIEALISLLEEYLFK